MRSEAKSVKEYLAELPPERKKALGVVRKAILERLPPGYEEAMSWGMIAYEVPLSVFPDTYNGKPLLYAALASQKNHMAVYLSAIYADDQARERFEASYRATGKRFDVGKSCVRFRKLDDLPLDVVADAIGSIPVDEFVDTFRAGRGVKKGRGAKERRSR